MPDDVSKRQAKPRKRKKAARSSSRSREAPAQPRLELSPADLAALEADKQLKREALEAIQRGEKPTRAQSRGWKRYDATTRAQTIREGIAVLPKKLWVEASGRDYRVLTDMARKYGVPTHGPTVNLWLVARWLYDFLADNGGRLAVPAGDDPLMFADSDSPALERLRLANAELKELELAERRGQLVPVAEMLEVFGQSASHLRNAGDRLQKECGAEAFAIFCEGLDEAEDAVDRHYAISGPGDEVAAKAQP